MINEIFENKNASAEGNIYKSINKLLTEFNQKNIHSIFLLNPFVINWMKFSGID